MISILIALVLTLIAGRSAIAQTEDLNTQLMLCTLKIVNPDSTATAFILTRPAPNDASKTQFILVSAAHVFSQMKGDEATLMFRKEESDGGYAAVPAKIKIRREGKNLWTQHPKADVAVMYVSPPAEVIVPALSVDLLARDEDLKKYEIHPGEAIRGVGYPHANCFEPNKSGFAVVRVGCIASFPLLPTQKTRTFLADTSIFEGMSGGPVYLCQPNRFYGGKTHEGCVELILGLFSGQHWLNEEYKLVYGAGTLKQRLELAIVVHASLIREAIELLPHEP